ncbi:protein THEM6-like, partial [Cimex lectularius]|uniref:Protein THEM6 n=1 Tax=Cimex lectularius TaxID=79782 RepID=A0A8I6SJ32_CIMLE
QKNYYRDLQYSWERELSRSGIQKQKRQKACRSRPALSKQCWVDSSRVTARPDKSGWCWSTDIDYLLTHLNNAKYLRELDFARADFYQRTRLYQKIRSKGGGLVQGATTIRYRKFIKVFTMFKITSKIVFWDKANIYMEHRFLAPGDNFICAIAICKQRIINVDIEELMRNILMGEKSPAGIEAGYSKPQMQLSLKKWVESNEISSADLRNSC